MGSQKIMHNPGQGILNGMRVVELSAFVAVPMAGLTLSSRSIHREGDSTMAGGR